jgi:hypothetical protein
VFPWTVTANKRRELNKLTYEESLAVTRVTKKPRKSKEDFASNQPDSDYQLTTVTTEEIDQAHSKDSGYEPIAKDNVQIIAEENIQTKETTEGIELAQLREEHEKLKTELQEAKKEIKNLQYMLNNNRFNIEHYKNSDKDIEFYTGFSSFKMLILCFNLVEQSAKHMSYGGHSRMYFEHSHIGRPRALTTFQEFILALVRLRLGLLEKDLAHRFLVSESTVSVIVRTWIRFLRSEFEPLITLPPRDVIRFHSPTAFKELFPKVVIIVDCTEVEMERPSALDAQSACYSSYKSKPTMKSLMGITPSGVLAFVSNFFPGSSSDKEITAMSGFIDILQSGDEVMADKGFNVQDELAAAGVSLVMPAFLKGKTQFSVEESNKNKAIASLRIHVERLMERLKNWHILDRKIPISMAPFASDIMIVIGALSNFLPPLIA